jgi:hypothetical protein
MVKSSTVAGYDSDPMKRVTAALLRGIPMALAMMVATPQAVARGDTQAPQVSLTPGQIDFGKVAPGTRHAGSFTIANHGSSAVTVKSVVPSCKCTGVTALAGTVIAPGASVKLDATLDVPTTPGEKDAKVFVTFDGYAQPLIALLKADATLPVRATPAYIDALKGVASGTIRLVSEDGLPFRVLSAGGVAPVYEGFDAAHDAPRSQYALKWTAPTQPCESMPLWWIVETDRADCPIIALRVRHECTGSRADPTKADRFWFFPEPIAVAGRLNPGASTLVTVTIEHYNPKGRGAVVRSDWSAVKSVRALAPSVTASLESARAGARDDMALVIRVAAAADASGLLVVPVEVETATGRGVVPVVMQVGAGSAK